MRNTLFIVVAILLVSCGRKQIPQTSFIDETKTKTDTIVSFIDGGTDTIYSTVPCDSFTMVIRKTDTIYIRKIQKETTVKLVIQRDTVFRTPIVTSNIKINNKGGQIGTGNISEKTKKGDNITGDGNTITKPIKKGSSWIWIFIAGNCCWLIIQNVLYPMAKQFIPFANLTSNIGKGLLKLKFW